MTNIPALTIKDHAAIDMHKRAMVLEAKEAASSLMEYAHIARAMAQVNRYETTKLNIKRKMDIAYTITKKI